MGKVKEICMVIQDGFSPPPSRTWDKAKILTENGYKITFVGVDENRTLPSREKLEYGDVLRVHSGGIYGISMPILDNPLQILLMLINALKVSTEIYHVFGLSDILVGVFLKVLGKKVVYDISDDDPSYNNFPFFIQKLIRDLEGFLLKFYDAIVTVTDSLRRDRLRYKSNIKTLRYCPHPNFDPHGVSAPRDHPNTIVYLGEISSKKGIYEILESMPLVVQEIPNVRLLLIGGIPEDEKEQIENEILKRDLNNYIEITGWLPHIEISKYINQGKLGLVILRPWCYSYIMSIPNKFIEFMACGKPVIASDRLLEVRKIIRRERCGIAVNNNNVREIADAITYLLKHDEIREKMGERARKYIEKYHNWKILQNDLLEIFASL